MKIEEAIAAIDRMERDGVISRYAIGGAVGATFYLEPVATLDIDIFVALEPEVGSAIVSLDPILSYLAAHGGTIEGEYVVIGGWPVQFLPAGTALLSEALGEAVERDVGGIRARVFPAEHLAAIALQTGRAKDKARLLQFIEAGALDATRFQSILGRHNLVEAWAKFERQFLRETP
jgi:hypothetical protein